MKKRENIRNRKAELSTLSKDQLLKAILANPRCRPLLFLCNKLKLFEIIDQNPSDNNHPQFSSGPPNKDPELLNPSGKKEGIYLARIIQQDPSSEKYNLTMNKLSINLPELRQSCQGSRKFINRPELKLNPRESKGFIHQLRFKGRFQENKKFSSRQELNHNSQDNKRNTNPSEDSHRRKSMNQKLKNNLQDNRKYTNPECRLKDPFSPNLGLSLNLYYNNSPFSNPQELSNK